MAFKNTIGQREQKRKWPGWVKGFNEKGQIKKHYYLADDFKFDSQKHNGRTD